MGGGDGRGGVVGRGEEKWRVMKRGGVNRSLFRGFCRISGGVVTWCGV